MKKALGLKDKVLCLYAHYTLSSIAHGESSKAYQYVLDLSNELKITINYDKI